ncbi:hypothetical protein SAMN04490179_2834 [Pseudomonas antarctica]|uniref:Uncharacterized protein n=1 Tax=Pseudomonas antarctica TaxID=219572 RepID=A0A1G9Z3C3_9PSED|nr:hypothetical protein [Pseudomonas antarctica]KAF2410976.1 hypothetical protein PSAN_34100 [Pseudomonas antarctica]SDN15789.1 hypothetical protein SAMN04490179_2834 [Pseudomonas antarctica]
MIINISDAWRLAVVPHNVFLKALLIKGIQELNAKSYGSPIRQLLVGFLIANFKTILSSSPGPLPSAIEAFHMVFPGPITRAIACELLKEIFDYDAFSKKPMTAPAINGWHAYQLCALCPYKFCPYCQFAPIDTKPPLKVGAKSYRPDLDHYYSQSRYPFLALTLGNFIPSCKKCNGPQMKGAVDFSTTPHLHPLSDEEVISFSLVPLASGVNNHIDYLALEMPPEKYVLKLRVRGGQAKAVSSIHTFQLYDRYRVFVGDAYYLARTMRGHQSRAAMLDESFSALNILQRDSLGFDPKGDSYKNSYLGKLKIDIARNYGLPLV